MSDHQPTAYATLLDHAVDKPLEFWDSIVKSQADILATNLHRAGLDALRDAYLAGVRDGFAQGVAAESDRQSSGGTTCT